MCEKRSGGGMKAQWGEMLIFNSHNHPFREVNVAQGAVSSKGAPVQIPVGEEKISPFVLER